MSRPAVETVARASGACKRVSLALPLRRFAEPLPHLPALVLGLLEGHAVDVGASQQARLIGCSRSAIARARNTLVAQGLVARSTAGDLQLTAAVSERAMPGTRPLPWALLDAGLQPGELVAAACWMAQVARGGAFAPSARSVARDAGTRQRSASAALGELLRLGLVERDGTFLRLPGWKRSVPRLRLVGRLVRATANKATTLQRWQQRAARGRQRRGGGVANGMHLPTSFGSSLRVGEPRNRKREVLAPQRRRRNQRRAATLALRVVVHRRRAVRQPQREQAENRTRQQLQQAIETGHLRRAAWRNGNAADAIAAVAMAAGVGVLPGMPKRSANVREVRALSEALANKHGAHAFDAIHRDVAELVNQQHVRSVAGALLWRMRSLLRAPNVRCTIHLPASKGGADTNHGSHLKAPTRAHAAALSYLAGAVVAGDRKHVRAAWKRCAALGIALEQAADQALVSAAWLQEAISQEAIA